MAKTLKKLTIDAMLWNTIQRFSVLVIQFVSTIVLARLLMPADFGVIAMLNIFIVVSNVFIDGGLGAALIQKKNITDIDYSTAFCWNLVLSILLSVILFITAPKIAEFYKMPILVNVLRVQSSLLIINSFSVIPTSFLMKAMRFKTLAIRYIIAALIGTVIAVILALNNFGVWSLVWSNIVSKIAGVVLLWSLSPFKPSLKFNKKSLISLFSFGGLVMFSNIIEKLYTNIQALIIGRLFSADDLGYYSKAYSVQQIPAGSLSTVISSVAFPALSSLQENKNSFYRNFVIMIKSIAFLSFPIMVLLIVIAQPFFVLLFTEKWIDSVPYFQILCLYGMFFTLITVNNNVSKALGKGKLFFCIKLIERIIGIIFILIGIRFGIIGMLWGMVFSAFFSYLIGVFFNNQLIQYGFWKQIKDIGSYFLLSLMIGLVTYYLGSALGISSNFIKIIVLGSFYITAYLVISYLLKMEGLKIYYDIIKNKLKSVLNG